MSAGALHRKSYVKTEEETQISCSRSGHSPDGCGPG